MKFGTALVVLAALLFPSSPARAQGPASPGTAKTSQVLRVFLDCATCDFNNIRQDITYINYVVDRGSADIHVLITAEGTATGGREYTFEFISLGVFAPERQRHCNTPGF
ncbi:MAG: hypothetical protein EXQ49_08875, partial [Acidobacteria bacterium]|nr:hypothetical protein [Acidobacteriota bacterium]